VSSETELARLGYVREMAHRFVYFTRAVPSNDDFGVGYMLGERIAGMVADQTSDPAELAWLIEIMGDCIAVLASALREEHLAKSDAQ
jgi:hypothetical protein